MDKFRVLVNIGFLVFWILIFLVPGLIAGGVVLFHEYFGFEGTGPEELGVFLGIFFVSSAVILGSMPWTLVHVCFTREGISSNFFLIFNKVSYRWVDLISMEIMEDGIGFEFSHRVLVFRRNMYRNLDELELWLKRQNLALSLNRDSNLDQ